MKKNQEKKIALIYNQSLETSKTDVEAASLVFQNYLNIFRYADTATAYKTMTIEEVEEYYRSSAADSRYIRRHTSELELVKEHHLNHYIFYYEVHVKLNMLFTHTTLLIPEIQMIILDKNKTRIRLLDLYSMIESLDCYLSFFKEEDTLKTDLIVEMDVKKIRSLPKFLDNSIIHKILESLNIIELQRQAIRRVVFSHIQNNVKYFSNLGLIPKLDINHLIIKEEPVRFNYSLPRTAQDLFIPKSGLLMCGDNLIQEEYQFVR